MTFSGGSKGAQSSKTIDQFLITNAQDLENTTFACYIDQQFVPHNMTYAFANNILMITPSEGSKLKFSDFISIQYGGKNDLNLCNPATYNYKPADPLPDLTKIKGNVTIRLNHDILKPIDLTIRVIFDNIVNVKWTWADASVARKVFAVPDQFITTDNVPTS